MKKLFSILPVLALGLAANTMAQDSLPSYPLHYQNLPYGVKLAYTEVATDHTNVPPLVLLHGLGGSRKHWYRNLPGLSRHYRCLVPDLPGYGQSDIASLPDGNILSFFSETLLAFMDSLQLPSAVLVGHSMGGQLATLFALQHPERVQALVLAAPAGLETFTETEAASILQYARYTFPQKLSEAQLRQNLNANFSKPPAQAEMLLQDRLALNNAEDFPQYAQVLLKGVEGMLSAPVANQLSHLKPPVLILFGKEDALIPNRLLHPNLSVEAVAKQAQEQIPQAQLQLISPAGHLLQFEQPEDFNNKLHSFLTPLFSQE
jgi:pimeloyl-ACP methyl ester carboxylesterase